jgi:hypothetical protein
MIFCLILLRLQVYVSHKISPSKLRWQPMPLLFILSIYPAHCTLLHFIAQATLSDMRKLQSLCTINYNAYKMLQWAVPWLRRLVVGLSPRRSEFNPGSVHVGFVVDKVALGQVLPEYFSFPLSASFHQWSITRRNEKKLIIFITGLHNKPQGCGASVASAAGPFTTKKMLQCLRTNEYY